MESAGRSVRASAHARKRPASAAEAVGLLPRKYEGFRRGTSPDVPRCHPAGRGRGVASEWETGRVYITEDEGRRRSLMEVTEAGLLIKSLPRQPSRSTPPTARPCSITNASPCRTPPAPSSTRKNTSASTPSGVIRTSMLLAASS